MEMNEYSVNEGDGVVEVCVQLMVAPADGLQCSIVAITHSYADGAKAGMSPSVCYSVGTILFGNSLFSVLMAKTIDVSDHLGGDLHDRGDAR